MRALTYVRPRPAPHVFQITARHRFWAHSIASDLSCVAFFGGLCALLWGAS